MTSAPLPSTELTGRPRWGRKQHEHGHIHFGQRSPRGSCCSVWRHVFTRGFGFNPCQWKEIWTWILTMPSVTNNYAFSQWCRRYNRTDSDWNTWGRCGLTLWQVWRPARQRQKWTDTVASVETKATETEVDWHCGKCGDQRDRQKVKLKQDPALSFQEAGPEVSTQLIGKTETFVNPNVECFTPAVTHLSSIRLHINTLRLGLCQRLAALFSLRQCL